jgi:hypothetical protein
MEPCRALSSAEQHGIFKELPGSYSSINVASTFARDQFDLQRFTRKIFHFTKYFLQFRIFRIHHLSFSLLLCVCVGERPSNEMHDSQVGAEADRTGCRS